MISIESQTYQQRQSYLAKLIIKHLQELGGQAERSTIRERIFDENEDIAEYAKIERVSKKTGEIWHPFAYNFNFAFKDLLITGYVSYTRSNPTITLTEKGASINMDTFDFEKEVFIKAAKYYEENREKKKNEAENTAESNKIDDYEEAFKTKLLNAISSMPPKKFELFSRALLSKMGVEFTSVGTQISNDGGIDGYGYCRTDDFRTSRVVIQCKRWQGNVGSPEIDQFLGAMNKFQADYGIFITNSRYSSSAREAARAGTPITLIDGDELVRLVKKYQLYIYPVTTYELDDFYNSEEQ